ncbi:hypothetical protein OSB04_027200 [Centaurea solstitialis]|uniref:F-box domain-containing protein n=1 Tax=Centaurea solstitialis TaxID=347529 RepID=A0AA38W811_9ASTR|nr:hypothetical protein OSB04_027200 [Centaurea solstitialis]
MGENIVCVVIPQIQFQRLDIFGNCKLNPSSDCTLSGLVEIKTNPKVDNVVGALVVFTNDGVNPIDVTVPLCRTQVVALVDDDLQDLDQLSRLSDDILVSILSYLPLKDAAVTSKLSRRWRYLWCQMVRLDFEDKERSAKLRTESLYSNEYNNLCFAERNSYIDWVNCVISKYHQSPNNIVHFRICFNLDKTAKGAMTRWIKFAVSKNVQTLELDLSDNDANYVFPHKIFDRRRSKQPSSSSVPTSTVEIKFLKALVLKQVDVNDECLNKILSNCPVLEHLSIREATKLVKPKINGKGLALKNLEFGGSCSRVQSIEIRDSNIGSLNCGVFGSRGSPVTLRLDNLQKLEKICISKCCSWEKINHMFCGVSCCIPRLQLLELQLYHPELHWCSYTEPLDRNRNAWQVVKQPHQHLEVVEICNYYGLENDHELAMNLIMNAVALKKLVIQPFNGIRAFESDKVMDENGARQNAKQQLEPIIPVGVELVIL